MILSICIPTLPEPRSREHMANLKRLIEPQLTSDVELVIDDRPRNVPTGTKRSEMYQLAKGKYVCSVDCDDWIAPDYVSSILEAAKQDTDCITFDGWYTENGRNHVDWSIKLNERYEARHDAASGGKYMFFRFPNHLVPIKKSIATRVRFPDIWHGEDFDWAKKINGAVLQGGVYVPSNASMLKTSVHIYKQLYHYDYRTNK